MTASSPPPRAQYLHLPPSAELRPLRGDAGDQRRVASASLRPQHARLGPLRRDRHRLPGDWGLSGRGFGRPLRTTSRVWLVALVHELLDLCERRRVEASKRVRARTQRCVEEEVEGEIAL